MIPFADPDCNKVTLTKSPHITLRCTQPEGHAEPCDMWRSMLVVHTHRAHVPTVTAPFPPAVGRRRRTTGDSVADGANRVDAALRRWNDVARRAQLVLA